MLVFGVKNRDLNVVPGKGADRILGLPQRERDEHCPLTLVAPKHPRTPVPRSLTVLGEARLSDVFGILVGVGSEHRARPGARDHLSSSRPARKSMTILASRLPWPAPGRTASCASGSPSRRARVCSMGISSSLLPTIMSAGPG